MRFLSRGSGYAILLAPSEIALNLRAPGKPGQPARQSAIRMSFPGARSSAAITGVQRQSAVSSYFVGKDPSKWLSGIPNYSRVQYHGVYPGIDLVLYGNQGRLEYDFAVAPGADPGAIRLAFDGVAGMRIDGAGDLIVSAAAGEMRQHKPIVYQESGGLRQTIDGRYVLQAHNRVAFQLGGYDARKPLIIDPALSFATYLGSPGDELDFALTAAASQANYPAVAVDQQGNVYATGFNAGDALTFTGHPSTLTAAHGGGGTDVFVVKMNSSGALVYDVVFGGGYTDVGGGIAVDSLGNAYVTGFTSSPNFPITAGAPQSSNNGLVNAFVAKVNTAGTALVYSTYLGGSGSFWGRAIAVDHAGNAYVTGTASASGSIPFPLANPISSTASAGFLSEVNSTGTAFVYSTFLGAGIGYGVAVDGNGDAYVTGSTGSASAPSPAQGYVLKVDAGGGVVGYGPVLLGSFGLQTAGFGIALDAQNDAYVTGMTNDPSFPQITSGAAQTKYGGGSYDGFALKLNSSGSLPPLYGTYIGGQGSNLNIPERGSGIGVDSEGNAYVSGTTECIGFPAVNPISAARNGGPEVLMQGTVSGSSSNWSPTALTGPFDQVNALAFDASGNLYAGASALNAAGGGVYKLAGGTWTSANNGINSTTIDAIAVDPNASSIVYAAGSQHLYQTTNGGGSWTELSQAVGTSAAIAIAKTSPSTEYVGSSAGLIYSTNEGSSWNNPTTLPGTGAVNALAVDPNHAETAYAGTPTGVYQTVDGGAHWTAVNTGLPAAAVT
ncbi:MAG: SBBP repeat-containing protein, partial [Bryobacteraceae bacterium]